MAYTVLAFGDSLMSGYNLRKTEAFPAQLEAYLHKNGYTWINVINAGVSGETTKGGLARAEWVLKKHNPDLVILELGGNDALRGVDPAVTYNNLDRMLNIFRQKRVPVLLAGMKAPRNMGAQYIAQFDSIYPRLSERYKVPLYKFFLEGVAMNPQLNQRDGIHPNANGIAVMATRFAPFLVKTMRYYHPEKFEKSP